MGILFDPFRGEAKDSGRSLNDSIFAYNWHAVSIKLIKLYVCSHASQPMLCMSVAVEASNHSKVRSNRHGHIQGDLLVVFDVICCYQMLSAFFDHS